VRVKRVVICLICCDNFMYFSIDCLVILSDNGISLGARGSVAVKALHYKPAGRGFDSRWCHWNFSVT
jgi:hypothetical protein